MRDFTKTKLAELHNKSDEVIRDAYQAGEDNTYRWFIDKLQSLNVGKEIMLEIMMKFVEERKGYPTREELKKHYEEYLSNLGKKTG